MQSRQIPESEWRTTLDSLSRSFDGVTVSLEIVGDDVGAEEEVHRQPLRGISADAAGVTMQFEKEGGMHLQHLVAHPKTLRVVETDEGALMAVEVEDDRGVNSFLRFEWPSRAAIFDPAVE